MKALITNVGRVDQTVRIAAGLALILLFGTGVIGPWGLIGIVPLATGLLRTCPVYRLLGIDTCGADARRVP